MIIAAEFYTKAPTAGLNPQPALFVIFSKTGDLFELRDSRIFVINESLLYIR